MKTIWPVLLLLLLSTAGCSTYIGLDPEFGRNPKKKNRVAIQWCVVDHANSSPRDPLVSHLVVAAASKRLHDQGYVIVDLTPPVEIQEPNDPAATNAPSSDTVAALVSLHRTAITNPQLDWTDGAPVDHTKTFSFRNFHDITDPLPRRIIWPPAGFDPNAAAKVDCVLFLALDYYIEDEAERISRRKDNQYSVPLAVISVPLAIFAGGYAGAPRIYTETSSWIRGSAIILSADDGHILYRQHIHFQHSDARETDALRDDIEELFNKLPDGD